MVFWTLLEAISIFMGLPSRGTPSYCFIAAINKCYHPSISGPNTCKLLI